MYVTSRYLVLLLTNYIKASLVYGKGAVFVG